MSKPFLHDDEQFEPLIRIVAGERRLPEGIVEKDYWVTHSLWWLSQSGLAIYFKGGTSLSKGFGLIQRFSEDVDLTIDRGEVSGLPELGSLRSDSAGAIGKRKAFFEALVATIDIPGITETTLVPPADKRWISVEFHAHYPKRYELPGSVLPFVRLEPGLRPWKPPTVPRALTSFLHDHVEGLGSIDKYSNNRPTDIACVHPFVTMLDKLDSVVKRYDRKDFSPEEFVRHYEDLAHLIDNVDVFPPLSEEDRTTIIGKSLGDREVLPNSPALLLEDDDRREQLEAAHEEIRPMFWGDRVSLKECCAKIIEWLEENPLKH